MDFKEYLIAKCQSINSSEYNGVLEVEFEMNDEFKTVIRMQFEDFDSFVKWIRS